MPLPLLAPKLLVKLGIVAGKVLTSVGMPYILPVRKPHPLPVRLVKWYFFLVVLPGLVFLDMHHPASYAIAVVGAALGAWAFVVVVWDWYTLRSPVAAEAEQHASDP